MVLMAIWFHVWQDDVRDLMGVAHLKWYDYPLTGILSLVVLFTLVEIGQVIRLLVSFLVGQLDRIAPFRLSATIVVVAARGADDHAAQRCGGQVRDAHHEQHLRLGEQRDESRYRAAENPAAVRWPAVAGVVGVAGPPGPHLRRGRPQRRRTHRIQRRPGHRADPGLRRAELRGRHHGDRRTGGPRTAAHRRTATRRRRGRHHHRYRLDQRGGGRRAGVHVQRQHRDREHAVLVLAQLAVVPGGQGERPARRARRCSRPSTN